MRSCSKARRISVSEPGLAKAARVRLSLAQYAFRPCRKRRLHLVRPEFRPEARAISERNDSLPSKAVRGCDDSGWMVG
jgi:hypothetical protein